MPRYVVLEHDWPHRHWDFLLEFGEACRTWRLELPPESRECAAETLADHRLLYLDYEGRVSGDRGHVRRHDFGEYEILWESPDRLRLRLRGRSGESIVEIRRDNDRNDNPLRFVTLPNADAARLEIDGRDIALS